jgi:hypothetical protein
MWVSHFAPAFYLKPLSPSTPLGLLALAGALPDILWLILSITGIEEITYNLHDGCFPYNASYPYTHSALGIALISVLFATFATLFSGLGGKTFLVLTAAGLSHWVLDVLVHRHDMPLTSDPSSQRYGLGWFDFNMPSFLLDLGLLLGGLIFYASSSLPATKRMRASRVGVLAFFFAGMQVVFNFIGVPGEEARWVHAPLFLVQLISVCCVLDVMEKSGGLAIDDVGGEVKRALTESERVTVEKQYDGRGRETEKVRDAIL